MISSNKNGNDGQGKCPTTVAVSLEILIEED
jgi:hypothetical protein